MRLRQWKVIGLTQDGGDESEEDGQLHGGLWIINASFTSFIVASVSLSPLMG